MKTTFPDISRYAVDAMFKKYSKLGNISYGNLTDSWQTLKSISLQNFEIRQHPDLLLCNANALENRYMRLKECGYRQVTAHRLKHHCTIMSQSVYFNKCYNFLPPQLNIFLNIALTARINFTDFDGFQYDESKPLKDVHLAVTKMCLEQRLKLTKTDVSKLIHQHPSLKHRSVYFILQTIDMLEHSLSFPIDWILRNNLLAANYLTTKKLIEMRDLCQVDVRTIISIEPQILKLDFGHIMEIRDVIEQYGVSKYAVICCADIFLWHPDRLMESLHHLRRMKIPNLFKQPAILRLAHALGRINFKSISKKDSEVQLRKVVE